MSTDYFMKAPCANCPFRKDVQPFLHPERAYEIARHAQNPYNTFPCHKTTESVEDDDGNSDRIAVATSKECAGFLTLRANDMNEGIPKNFKPSFELCYQDALDMEWHYQEAWNKNK